ncbi:peptidylprolyl isomerase [Hymenobacter sp. J193]|uniref:peptidylprolyl isomerase n=1 Tax=Hymenobacter sp. J193 TaxID=2898429 RepID=UPI002151E3B9|nr:peptidylprolyl isomerase [Hymenobacter sp. J193]MCR5887072.1 peptidylprolyl isomerase [Hymenobacter sp. J193]
MHCLPISRVGLPLALSILLAATGCATRPVATTAVTPVASAPNKFADATLRQIATAQDERNTTALLPYLSRPEPRYRREAALAFASVQDRAAVAALTRLLASDAEADVRRAAAFALGQTADTAAATQQALLTQLTAEPDRAVRRYVLEAMGRCATRASLADLVRLPAALATDTSAQVGQAWGLYRAALRGITSEAAVARAVQLLPLPVPYRARLAAASTLSRIRNLNLTPYTPQLTRAAQTDPDYAVRAACAVALGKSADAAVPATLAGLARRDTDYRVRLSAIRAMSAGMYAPVKEAAWAALTDANAQVALTAAEFFLNHASKEPGELFLTKANKLTEWRARATLLGAALKNGGPARDTIRQAIMQRYATATSPYEKGYLLKALSEDPKAYKWVEEATFASNQPVVIGTYGMEALVAMRQQKDFPSAQHAAFARTLQRGVSSGDLAIMGTAAEAIRDPKLGLRSQFPSVEFLTQARSRLTLPRDLEAWQSLQLTIDYLQNKPATPQPVAAAATHPINWDVVQRIPIGQKAIVHTGRGPITFTLLVEQAPGSVASFVELVRQGFYEKKNFHRVVPNFVAQGGCPRGDGWGSSDYNLRSEFADLRYVEGAVGLASAGKDTESCQWFITHAPTPHLDGRYTIFAQVEQGMDVLSQLEIGDRIDRIELLP